MAAFRIEFTNERILPTGGLTLTGLILKNADFISYFNKTDFQQKHAQKYIKPGDIFGTYIGMLTSGKPEYESIHEMYDDPEYCQMALGIEKSIPSEATLRQRFDEVGDSKRKMLLNMNVDIIKKNGTIPSSLPNGMCNVDIDVSPMNNSKSKKEGVSRTCRGTDGFAPMFACMGREGYCVNTELRPGKQHSQSHTPEFLKETIDFCKKLTRDPLLFRLDSGNDARENMAFFLESGCYFIIKRNLRRENTCAWLESVKDVCTNITNPRDGKTVYKGQTFKQISYRDSEGNNQTKMIRVICEITERSIDKHGQFLFPHEVEVETWWDNTGFPDQEVIDLYHAHGEMEQYHSEIKSDMNVERLPSGKFATNQLILELTMIAYNILRLIGDEAVSSKTNPARHKVRRRRAKTVIENIIMIPCHVITHARQIILGLGRSNVWRKTFYDLYT